MSGLLTVTELHRRFGVLAALGGVTMTLRTGARHAVVGPNGAGKTTLINVVAGLLRPHAGSVYFAGRDITGWSATRRSRSGIARTFQTPAVCDSLTVGEHLVLGGWRHHRPPPAWWRRTARHRRVSAHTADLLAELGLTALVDQPAGALSHGQRRLIEIGIALAARPRLLLLDEPAAGLTDHDLPRLVDTLRRLPSQLTLLLVDHHLELVTAIAEAVTVLHQGTELLTGPPAQVLQDQAVADVYLGARP